MDNGLYYVDLGAKHSHTPAYKLEGEQLVANRYYWFHQDYYWKESKIDIKTCDDLYHSTSSSAEGFPRRNMIRRVVQDQHAVAIQNVPKVKMIAPKFIGSKPGQNPIEKHIQFLVLNSTEKNLNLYMNSVMGATNYKAHVNDALKHAAIFGAGFVCVDLDRSADTRLSPELRDLMKKPMVEWTSEDADKYVFLTKRIAVKHVDSRDVFTQEAIKRFDEEMYRVSVVERINVRVAREQFNNPYILATSHPFYIVDDNTNNSMTTKISTWELFPYTYTKSLETTDGAEITKVDVTDWIMLKTVIIGGQLIDKEIVSNFPDMEGMKEGVVQLPIIPFYLNESENHPYGQPIPLQYKTSEEFINLMYLMLYKSARKSVSNNGLVVLKNLLGKNDLAKIDRVLEEGGTAEIDTSNLDSKYNDIRQIIQPLNYLQSNLNPVLLEALKLEERGLQGDASTPDQAAMRSARTGAGKLAQLQVTDRPKTVSINNLARSSRKAYDLVYANIQVHHKEKVEVTVDVPGGGRQILTLNQEYRRAIPVLDEAGNIEVSPSNVSPDNPTGVMVQELNMIFNDTRLQLKAATDHENGLPTNPIQRLEVLVNMQNAQWIEPETARDLYLTEDVKVLDEPHRRARLKNEEQQMEKQKALEAAQRVQTNNGADLESSPTLQAPPAI